MRAKEECGSHNIPAKIPPGDFRWYAAFHDEGEHPHIHMMAWSAKPGQAYLSKEGIRQIKSKLTNDIFRNEMGKYSIETLDDLYADREKIQQDMDTLIARRAKLQNKIRRATPAEKETLRQEKAGVTEQITTLRKQLKLNQGIEARSVKIQEKTDLYFVNEIRAKEAQQQKKPQRRERDAR